MSILAAPPPSSDPDGDARTGTRQPLWPLLALVVSAGGALAVLALGLVFMR